MMIDLRWSRAREQLQREAIIQASSARFRPIMMTTLAALFGALPLALEGARSELRNRWCHHHRRPAAVAAADPVHDAGIYLAMERVRARLAPVPPAIEQQAETLARAPAE